MGSNRWTRLTASQRCAKVPEIRDATVDFLAAQAGGELPIDGVAMIVAAVCLEAVGTAILRDRRGDES